MDGSHSSRAVSGVAGMARVFSLDIGFKEGWNAYHHADAALGTRPLYPPPDGLYRQQLSSSVLLSDR
jgi:hypothetical protein